jgi:hypothetical protein
VLPVAGAAARQVAAAVAAVRLRVAVAEVRLRVAAVRLRVAAVAEVRLRVAAEVQGALQGVVVSDVRPEVVGVLDAPRGAAELGAQGV